LHLLGSPRLGEDFGYSSKHRLKLL
jgi:hypothetical protein